MNRLVFHTRVGGDGILHLEVPIGEADANREVEVTIKGAEPEQRTSLEKEAWQQFVMETAGAWQGNLERPDQGEYERRDELP
jgi:hypothetical protein